MNPKLGLNSGRELVLGIHGFTLGIRPLGPTHKPNTFNTPSQTLGGGLREPWGWNVTCEHEEIPRKCLENDHEDDYN